MKFIINKNILVTRFRLLYKRKKLTLQIIYIYNNKKYVSYTTSKYLIQQSQ